MTEQNPLPDLSSEKDFDGEAFAPIYTTTVTVSGGTASHGRASGRARSADGALDLHLRMPAELGGEGHGDLVVKWPGIDPEIAAPLLEKADSLCPYAKMAWQGTPTTITLAP